MTAGDPGPTWEFDRDTAVATRGGGVYAAAVSARWNVGARPNGGHLMAIATRALAAELVHPDPFAVSAHFLSVPEPGAAEIHVETLRQGRSLSTGSARLMQAGREHLRLLATFGDLSAIDGPTRVGADPPQLPPPEACVPAVADLPGGVTVEVVNRFDLRLAPSTVGWVAGRPSGRAAVGGWLRFADGREPDPLALVQVVDTLPPAVFDLGAVGWVPSIEMTVHVRARPLPGWLRCWVRTRFLINGYLEEDAEVWDADGMLVAQSRQLARVSGAADAG